jgi:hypothetical protein
MTKDTYSNMKPVTAVAPVAVGTTGVAGGKLSAAIDRKGYGAVTFVTARGVSAAATDTINHVVYESDATNATFTSVADADLIGTEAGAVMTGSAALVSKIGYKGNKRYLKLRLYGLGTATSPVSAVALMRPIHMPAA